MSDLVFEVVQDENIVTQADTWEELRANVLDATAAFFFNQSKTQFALISFSAEFQDGDSTEYLPTEIC